MLRPSPRQFLANTVNHLKDVSKDVLFLRPFAPPPNEVVLFSSGGACLLPQWSTGTDQSIGGHSSATLSQSEDGLRFRGVISMALDRGVSGAVFTGYAAMRSLPRHRSHLFDSRTMDCSQHRFLKMRVRGDHRSYFVNFQPPNAPSGDLYQCQLHFLTPYEWEDIVIPFEYFRRVNCGQEYLRQYAPDMSRVEGFGWLVGDGVPGPFDVQVQEMVLTNLNGRYDTMNIDDEQDMLTQEFKRDVLKHLVSPKRRQDFQDAKHFGGFGFDSGLPGVVESAHTHVKGRFGKRGAEYRGLNAIEHPHFRVVVQPRAQVKDTHIMFKETKQRNIQILAALALILGVVIYSIPRIVSNIHHPLLTKEAFRGRQEDDDLTHPQPTPNCVSRSGGLGREGVGSFFQHIKSSVILAQLLQAELHVEGVGEAGGHGYTLTGLFRHSPCPPPSTRTPAQCTIQNHTELAEMLPSICAGLLRPASLMGMFDLQGCETVYHRVPFEIYADLNDCVAPFYQRVLEPFVERAVQQYPRVTDCVNVGVHIRWGDVGQSNVSEIRANTRLNFRAVSIKDINAAWNNLRFVNCTCTRVFVYIKNGPGFAKRTFAFGDRYRVVDTGDDLLDVAHYSATNDILIQGKSSYPVLGLFAATERKVVITDAPGYPKYRQRFSMHPQHSVFSTKEKVFYAC